MKVRIEIDTSNAAFHVAGEEMETARILRQAADKVECIGLADGFSLRDTNGNTVGVLTIEEG